MKVSKDQIRNYAAFLMFLMTVFPLRAQVEQIQPKSTKDILQEFIESYKTDPMAMDAVFGIKVGEQWWHVMAERQQHPYRVGKNKQYTFHDLGPHEVTLFEGQPSKPTWYFRFDDKGVLEKFYNKSLMAGTAAAKSTGADIVTFDIEDMEGFDSTHGDTSRAYIVMEHFWKPDPVEVTRFSRDSSLPTHGASIVSLYMMKDKRISWFTLGQEEVANGDRGLDKGQCPNLIIVTKGKGKAQIGEEEIDLEPGMSIFVGPYVKHVFYNPNPEPLEGILVLYGDNVDYAKGQSYPDFLEKQVRFYAENEAEVAAEQTEQNKSDTAGRGKE
jgi:mannose-6-phosphate isomerase-like protein (cupin superfamily)